MDVANAPGEPILPGELAKALQILADGGESTMSAPRRRTDRPGESAGNYREIVLRRRRKITTAGFR
jgi:branched-chain amino acid transport system substrate-binding protein